MTKDQKLKKSKSVGDILQSSSSHSVPLAKSHSNPPLNDPKYPYTTLISQQQELVKLQKETTAKSDTISLLRKKIEELETQLKNNPPTQLLKDQLTEKQQQIENLRSQLETKPALTELDQSLSARHQNLKSWWKQYVKSQKLDQELVENINEASNELVNQDKMITNLQSQITKLKLTNQSLTKDLNLATKLAELRKSPLPHPENSFRTTFLYGLALVLFINLLNSAWNNNNNFTNHE